MAPTTDLNIKTLPVSLLAPLIVRHAVLHPFARRVTADITCLRAVANLVLRTRRVTDRQTLPVNPATGYKAEHANPVLRMRRVTEPQALPVNPDIKRAAALALKTERSIPVRRA